MPPTVTLEVRGSIDSVTKSHLSLILQAKDPDDWHPSQPLCLNEEGGMYPP